MQSGDLFLDLFSYCIYNC